MNVSPLLDGIMLQNLDDFKPGILTLCQSLLADCDRRAAGQNEGSLRQQAGQKGYTT